MTRGSADQPRRRSFGLRMKTTRFVEDFPPGGRLRTISRAGLNGMRAIERGRKHKGTG